MQDEWQTAVNMGARGTTGMAAGNPTTGTAQVNGTLWGSAARDWAGVQEGQFKAGYQAVLAHCGVGDQTD
jgi:hypothetical protein